MEIIPACNISLAEAARDILDNFEIFLAVLFPKTTTSRAITYTNPSNFPKIQDAIKAHPAMLEPQTLPLLYFLHALFISGICSVPRPFLLIDRVMQRAYCISL